MADPDVRKRLAEGGLSPDSPTPEASARFIAKEAELWTGISKAVGATAD